MKQLRILFVCGRNQWRSPTAERIYRDDPRIDVRSAGLSNRSGHKLSGKDLAWANLVMVMERRHKTRILEDFREEVELPRIVSLDIPDDYPFMDPELIELLRDKVEIHLREELNP
jgi:predicted protein tyrosine phosphatase